MTRFIIIGAPGGPRIRLFGEALKRLGGPPAVVLPWLEVLGGRPVAPLLGRDTVLRIEPPGDEPDVRRLLLAAGAESMAGQRGEPIAARAALALPDASLGLRYARQHQLGVERVLQKLGREIGATRCMSRPLDLIAMMDRVDCHRRLRGAGLPGALALPGPLRDVGDLRAAMDDAGLDRIVVKPRYSPTGAAIVAYDRRGVPALITALRFDGETPYGAPELRRTEEPVEIHRALKWLLDEGAHAEAWLPKVRLDGQELDLRVVVIDGRARHAVARVARGGAPMSDGPFGERVDLSQVKTLLGVTWSRVRELAQQAAACFPAALAVGVELAVVPGVGPVLLSLDPFGDLLPGVIQRGEDTCETQLRALSARPPARDPAA